MRKFTFIAFLCTLLLVSCNQEEQLDTSSTTNKSGILFKLQKDGYEGSASRTSGKETSPYDELYYFIVDENGDKVKNIKSYYEAATSTIYTEGLHKGNYRLLVLGIQAMPRKTELSFILLNAYRMNGWFFQKTCKSHWRPNISTRKLPFLS